MINRLIAWAFPLVVFSTNAAAQEIIRKETSKDSAPALVRRGNELLLNDQPAEAIELYDRAQQAAPDAREIAFGKGLSYYKLGDWEKSRTAFEEAAAAKDDALTDDALYSIGTVDHAQALAGQQADPKATMSKLESAMQSYQSVLARNPRHEAARDANLKAATMWRQIKQQMQQQEQQQQSQPNQENQEQQQDQQEQQNQEQPEQDQQQESQQQQEQREQDQEQQQQQQSQQQQDSQQQSAEDQQSSDQEQQPSAQQQEQQDQKPPEPTEQESKEDVSREQAERQLREMLQALRDRKKERREQAKPMPIQRGTKDW